MKLRPLFHALLMFCGLVFGFQGVAEAKTARELATEVHTLSAELSAKWSKATTAKEKADAQAELVSALSSRLDFDVIAQRTMGSHWSSLDDSQKTEFKGLLRQLIEKTYRNRIADTVDYKVEFVSPATESTETRIQAKATHKNDSRKRASFAYLILKGSNGPKVVDLMIENASLTATYGRMFNEMMSDKNKGYAQVRTTLQNRIRSLG